MSAVVDPLVAVSRLAVVLVQPVDHRFGYLELPLVGYTVPAYLLLLMLESV